MSFLYPNEISISRSQSGRSLGAVGYNGPVPSSEALIASKVPAAVQMKGGSGTPTTELPGDASRRTQWRVLIPQSAVEAWTVETHDIVTDESGQRYQVIGPYRTPLGLQLLVDRLET